MTGELRALWSGHPPQVLATALPLLVMDMYNHSYQMHYGAGALKYIDAFFGNIKWNAVNRRLDPVRRARGSIDTCVGLDRIRLRLKMAENISDYASGGVCSPRTWDSFLKASVRRRQRQANRCNVSISQSSAARTCQV